MTTINQLTTEQVSARTAAYMRRSLSDLHSLAALMGLPADGGKAQIIARILGQSVNIETTVKPFDMSGLTARRLGVTFGAAK
jgi:hypothetical protein